jgi:hypothetical protein
VDASRFTLGNFITDATVRPSHGLPSGHRPSVRPSIRYRPRDNPEHMSSQLMALGLLTTTSGIGSGIFIIIFFVPCEF